MQHGRYETPTNMAGHSVYRRSTDRRAYSLGADIIAHFDHKFKEKGGMKAFMKDWGDKKMHQSMTTPEFQKDMEVYFNTSLGAFFDKYIYGKTGGKAKNDAYLKASMLKSKLRIQKYHPQLTEKQLLKDL